MQLSREVSILANCVGAVSKVCECAANSPSAHGLNSEGELANHGHIEMAVVGTSSGGVNTNSRATYNNDIVNGTAKGYESGVTTGYTGGNQPHNNLPPLYGAYKFRRTN